MFLISALILFRPKAEKEKKKRFKVGKRPRSFFAEVKKKKLAGALIYTRGEIERRGAARREERDVARRDTRHA